MSDDKQLKRTLSTASEMSEAGSEIGEDGTYKVSSSRLVRLINWMGVIRIYLHILWRALIGILILQVLRELLKQDISTFLHKEVGVSVSTLFSITSPASLGWKPVLLFGLIFMYISRKEKAVYLMDFKTFHAPQSWLLNYDEILTCLSQCRGFNEDSLAFMKRMLSQSGVGQATAWPIGVRRILDNLPHLEDTESSREEAQDIMFNVFERLLKVNNLKPKDVDCLIVNCSLFSPTPSLCTLLINRFNLRSDVISYNLSGMGCSAGVVAIDLAKNILNGRPNTRCIVISTEIITPNLYHGNERSFLLQNVLFRCGGAAILLSNRWQDAYRARFKLTNLVRTQLVTPDSEQCVYETEDTKGERGVQLSKELVKVAGRAMEKNLTVLGPSVLPLSEQIKVAIPMIGNMLIKTLGLKMDKFKGYVPQFTRGIDHFCIHAGGRAVIDGIEKNLNLSPRHVEASRHTLHTYGNTSSSSIWYELEYVCKNMNLKRGERVIQLAFGSGFKCNTAVWLCLNAIPFEDVEIPLYNEVKKEQEKKEQ